MPILHDQPRIAPKPTIRQRRIAAYSLNVYGYPIPAEKWQPGLRRTGRPLVADGPMLE
jgi:hypothetical protein